MSTPSDMILEHTNNAPETRSEHPFRDTVQFIIIALLIVIPIRFFVAQPFIVSGSSMVDTFHDGEYLIVDQLSYHFSEPERGDEVIFRYPKDPSKFFIKRVIGLPGDTVAINGDEVTISNSEHPGGFVLAEPYVAAMSENNSYIETLKDTEYFVMGDNRDFSSDSRAWGILTRDKIVGRAFLRLFPFTRIDTWPGATAYANEHSAT